MLVDVALSALDQVESDVVRLAYGLGGGDGCALPDVKVGARLAMSRSSVYRRRVRALAVMRHRLAVDVA